MSEKERVWRLLKSKFVLSSIVLGVLITLIGGVIENPPRVGAVDATYYGYPFVWRIVVANFGLDIRYLNLLVDVIFWFAISLLALVLVHDFYYREPIYE
ncbi:MAG: hypothetical protein QXJ11_06190 [Candidatus Bathyarchaeia archaeon]